MSEHRTYLTLYHHVLCIFKSKDIIEEAKLTLSKTSINSNFLIIIIHLIFLYIYILKYYYVTNYSRKIRELSKPIKGLSLQTFKI